MLLNCGVGQDSWESLGLQGDPNSPSYSPGCSLEGLMLKLKHQFFGHLMWRTDSLEKTLTLGKIEGKRRGWQRMRWLDGFTNSMDMSWATSGSWWWTGKPGVLQSIGLQRIWHDWVTELNWTQEHGEDMVIQGRKRNYKDSLVVCLHYFGEGWRRGHDRGQMRVSKSDYSYGLGITAEWWRSSRHIWGSCFIAKEFKDKVIGEKWIYLERNTCHRQNAGHLRMREPQNMAWLVFTGSVIP